MSQQLSLIATIEDVGSTLADSVDEEIVIPPALGAWMEKFGLSVATDPERIVCDLAAFNILLKTTLYRTYRQDGIELEPLSVDDDIVDKLAEARHVTDDNAFEKNPLDTLVDGVDNEAIAPLLEVRDAVERLEKPTDDIGKIFESLVPQAVRRKHGQFRTPAFIGEFMADWAITAGDDTVLDPGIGAGVLTACMYNAKQSAPEASRVDEMWGVDVSELAIVMASTGLKLENGEGAPNFYHHNYMDTMAEGTSARLDQRNPQRMPMVDAIVSNPPYSRSEALDDDRERYNNIIDAEASVSMWGQAPLFAYFFAHSEQFLADGGRLAFITSARFFDTVYGEDLRTFLRDRFAIHAFVFLELEEAVFEDTDVTPCITLLEQDSTGKRDDTTFVHVEQWPDNPETLIEAIEGEAMGETEFGYINRLNQQRLDPQTNWLKYVDPADIDAIQGLTTFSQLATIKRGIATGKNDYFCLTQAEVDEWGLDERYLSKLIRRTSGFDGLEITDAHWESWREDGDEVWLLYCYDDGDPIDHVTDEALEGYLEYGREIGADDSYLAANRSTWYVVDERDPPDILATYMSKDGFRFIRNCAGLRTLNNLHNIILPGFDDEEIDVLLAYLNSSVADEITKRSGRKYARGLHKIEPNELKDVPVMDPRKLSTADVKRLADVYTGLCKAISNGESQKATDKLNQVVRDVLGIPPDRES